MNLERVRVCRQRAAGILPEAHWSSWRPPFVFSACIGIMNLRMARWRLGLRQCSGAFGWLASIAKAPEHWRISKTWRGLRRFMESPLSFFRMHWNHELTPTNSSQQGNRQDADECLLPSREGSGVGRFMESLHSFFRMHRDHEPGLARSAGFPACGFGRLSSRPSLVHRTGKSGKPAGWKACLTFRFMERREGLREGVNLL